MADDIGDNYLRGLEEGEPNTFTCKLADPVDGSQPCQGDCGPWCSGFKCSYCEHDCKREDNFPRCTLKGVEKDAGNS